MNTIAVDLLEKVGFQEVIAIANRLGVGQDDNLEHYYPLAIGAYGETVLNMTAAYAGVANRGIFFTPLPIEEIRGPNGDIIWSQATHHSGQ